jgi:hypothetical protein
MGEQASTGRWRSIQANGTKYKPFARDSAEQSALSIPTENEKAAGAPAARLPRSAALGQRAYFSIGIRIE